MFIINNNDNEMPVLTQLCTVGSDNPEEFRMCKMCRSCMFLKHFTLQTGMR